MQNFEQFLEEKFIGFDEWNERAITKDNCEAGFEDWAGQLDPSEYMELGDEYFNANIVSFLDKKKRDLEKKGYIPTLELLIEELKEQKHA